MTKVEVKVSKATPKYDLDWSTADEETAKLFLRQAELYLDVQLRLLLAADTRAMTTAGALATLATAVVTATVALFGQAQQQLLLYAGLPIAAMLIIAAVVALRVSRPVSIAHAGTQPIRWWDHRASNARMSLIGGELEHYQVRIEHNAQLLAENGRRLNSALVIAASAPVVGAIAFLAAVFLPRF